MASKEKARCRIPPKRKGKRCSEEESSQDEVERRPLGNDVSGNTNESCRPSDRNVIGNKQRLSNWNRHLRQKKRKIDSPTSAHTETRNVRKCPDKSAKQSGRKIV